jgi:adenosylcobinamide amidohydrolase
MRKSAAIGLIAVIAVLLGATAVLYSKYRKTTTDYVALQAQDQETRDRFAGAINEIAIIQDSLNTIVLGDEAASLTPSQLQSEGRLTESQSDIALQRISVLKAGIERTKARVEQLDADLKKRGVRIAGLQRMIAQLKKNVEEKELYVAQLTGQVDSLQTQVTGLVATVQQNDQTIETQRRDMGTVYVAIGSKKDLKDAGLVEAKGGILGIGKTTTTTGNVDQGQFTAIDTDYETVIKIPSEKARVLSAQPPSSYQMQLVNGQMELHILDSEKFRSVKHVVIMTT